MKLLINEKGPWTDYFKISFLDFIAIGSNNTRVLFTLPPGHAITMVAAYCTKQFIGGAGSSFAFGRGGATELIDSTSLGTLLAGGPVYNTGTAGTQAAGTTVTKAGIVPLIRNGTAAGQTVSILVFDTAMATLTAGELIIAMQVAPLPGLS